MIDWPATISLLIGLAAFGCVCFAGGMLFTVWLAAKISVGGF